MSNKLYTPYDSMSLGYDKIPEGANAKLLIRHAHRPSLKGNSNPDEIHITQKGLEEAIKMGRSIPMQFGFCSSSPVLRCIETIRALTNANTPVLHKSKLLGYSFVENIETANSKFSDLGLKEIAFQMSLIKQDGFIDANKGLGLLLDFIFHHGGTSGQLDIFCTHDLQLALMDLLMYNNYRDSASLKKYWPLMLEGMWLWGERNDFYVCWRNQLKHCLHYLPTS